MSKFLYTHHSFNNGELNPRLLGRTDLKEYFSSGKEVTNFVVSPQGGLNEVLGTYYLGNSSILGRDAYFTWNEKYIFWNYNSLFELKLQSGALGDSFYIDSVSLSISNAPANINLFVYGTHVAINDTLFVTDKNGIVEPLVYYFTGGVLTLSSFSHWASVVNATTLSNVQARIRSIGYSPVNIDASKQLTFSAGNICTATYDAFEEGMVGKYIIVGISGTEDAAVEIVSYTSPSEVVVSAAEGSVSLVSYTLFRLPLWYSGNAPKGVSFFQNRLMFFNTPKKFDVIWNSITNNLAQFSQFEQDTDIGGAAPFQLQPASIDASPILWVVPERYVTMGTTKEEYIVSMNNGVYDNDNATIQSVSKYGSRDIGLAFRAQSSTFFVERGGETIREMTFSEENGGYVTRNLSIIGPDIGKIKNAFYDYSSRRIYITNGADELYICNIDTSAGLLGFSEVSYLDSVVGTLEWDGDSFLTNGDSIIQINNETTLVNLFGKGVSRCADFYDVGDGSYDFKLPNSYVSPAPSTIQVYTGTSWEDKAVLTASGHIAFPDGTKYFNAPSSYEGIIRTSAKDLSRIETTPIQQGSQIGDAQISLQRVDKVGVRVYDTKEGFKVGTNPTSLEVPNFTGTYSGVVTLNPSGIPEEDHTIIIENASENPLTLLSISMRGLGQEG